MVTRTNIALDRFLSEVKADRRPVPPKSGWGVIILSVSFFWGPRVSFLFLGPRVSFGH